MEVYIRCDVQVRDVVSSVHFCFLWIFNVLFIVVSCMIVSA